MADRRGGGGVEPDHAARGVAPRPLSQRQLGARADGPLRDAAPRSRAEPVHQLVPVPRRGLATVPALPGSARGTDGRAGSPDRARPGLSLVAVPAAVDVAGERLPRRPAVRRRPRRRGVSGGAVAVYGQRPGRWLRAAGVPVGGIRGVDPAVGLDDPSAGMGIELAGDSARTRLRAHGAGDLDHGRPALRDGVPGDPAAAAVAVDGPTADRDVASPGGAAGGRRRAGLRVGGRATA